MDKPTQDVSFHDVLETRQPTKPRASKPCRKYDFYIGAACLVGMGLSLAQVFIERSELGLTGTSFHLVTGAIAVAGTGWVGYRLLKEYWGKPPQASLPTPPKVSVAPEISSLDVCLAQLKAASYTPPYEPTKAQKIHLAQKGSITDLSV